MPVVHAHPDECRANPWNSNIVSPENEAKLDASLQRFGFFKPLVARQVPGVEGYEILGGEHRWAGAKRLGLDKIPVFDMGPISDAEAKEISLADNARYGADDAALLAEIFRSLGDESAIETFLPYSDADVKSIFSASEISLDDLELDEMMDAKAVEEQPAAAKVAKTHAIMRFKIPVADSERITALIATIQKRQGFTEGDQLENAGDALVFLVYASEKGTE